MADYPVELTSQLKPDDSIVSYLPLKKMKQGCLGTSSVPGGYVAITEQRLIFKGVNYNQGGGMSESTTNVPISKVSAMSVEHNEIKSGCLGGKSHSYFLSLNVQGGMYKLFIGTTPSTGNEFVRTFLERSE